jgi:hypothetical protein
MSVFKTTFSRALRIIPSDNANIPFTNVVKAGVTTGVLANRLKDNNGNFVVNRVSVGDIVYNTTTLVAATITGLIDSTAVSLNADIFLVAGEGYVIYQASSQTGIGNAGAFLYVGGAGNVAVTTIGGDDVIFNAVPIGTVLPVQVLKLKSTGTTATLINALW